MDHKWDKPNGCCGQCGAPINEYLVGGYRLHDGTTDAVQAFSNMPEDMCLAYREKINKRLKILRQRAAKCGGEQRLENMRPHA